MGEIVKLPVILHPNQEAVHASRSRNIVCKIGKRFGKTYLAVFKMCKWAGIKPNQTLWYITDTFRHAKSIAWSAFLEILPPKHIKRKLENELQLVLDNGSQITLIGSDNQEYLRGPKLHGVVFDEAAYIDPYVWNNIIRGQLLGVRGEPSGPAFFISSPNKKGRNWYSEFFEEALRKKRMGDADWDAFYFTVYDNPLLDRSEIEKIRADSTEDEWQTEYMANESVHAGQIYSEFDYARHVGENNLSHVSHFLRGVDWGIDHPTVCLFVQADELQKKIYIEDEYVKSGFTIEESCGVIKKMTGDRPVDWTVCDPSMGKRNSQTKRTDKQEFDRLGVWCLPGDNNDRGYNITKMFLKKDMVSISPKCRTLIKELKTVQWGDEEGEDTCFVAGTKILCENGEKNIEEVFIGDRVVTRYGLKKVLASGMTSGLADILELKTSDGRKVLGTKSHPFFLKNGEIVAMKDLQDKELFDSSYLSLIYLDIWKLRSLLVHVKTLMVFAITEWGEDIINGVLKMGEPFFSIERYGSIISGRFQKVFTSTISTMICPIIKSQILNPSASQSIASFICKIQKDETGQERIYLKQSQRPRNGTDLKKGESGIEDTLEKSGNRINIIPCLVRFAGESIKLLSRLALNFVTLIVVNAIPKDVRVLSVARLLTKQSVYNLTIEDSSEYVANGFLVHNCDTLRYICVRLHDTIFRGAFREKEEKLISPIQNRPFSFNDRLLFPDRREERQTQVREEVETY